jgi:cytochrome c
MNSFEINKILGAVLGTCLVLLALHIATGAIFAPPVPAKPGYQVVVKEEQPAKGEEKPAAAVPFDRLLATASAQHGAQIAKQCSICHNFQEGQGAKIGPDLYGVVGRPVASVSTFHYTAALKAKGGTWTFDALNKWITDPRADVPGTAMTFAGIKNDKQRADVIAFLDTLSKNPVPLPKPAADGGKPKAEGGKPNAEGGKPKAEAGKPDVEGGKPKAEAGKPDVEGGKPKAEAGKPNASGTAAATPANPAPAAPANPAPAASAGTTAAAPAPATSGERSTPPATPAKAQ